ncbi:MAG TPA: acetate/propionate family kinase [Nevskiaceae bacterium]
MNAPATTERGRFVLVLNCGSSSIKFALFDAEATPPARQPAWNGKVDGITTANATLGASSIVPAPVELDFTHPYSSALAHIRRAVHAWLGDGRIVGVAHRVVHGGTKYFEPALVDAAVLADLRGYIPLAPLHQPFALGAIAELLHARPDLPQVACFDTAFHRSMEEVERRFALPQSAWERGIRRYGFHGLSYEYMSHALAERYGDAARGRTIVAHLGSGASLCAMRNLESVATSMGFSALDGLMMGTRCGALDPGVVLYMMETERRSTADMARMLYHDSGLYGVSGLSPDPRALLAVEAENPRARLALAMYVCRIVREIGALAAVLGGLDMLIFTAGIGEHRAELRARVGTALKWMGVDIDAAANARHDARISTNGSRVIVGVEKTNEEWIAAKHALRLLRTARR